MMQQSSSSSLLIRLQQLLPSLFWCCVFLVAAAGESAFRSSKFSIEPRIIGGFNAPPGRFPYMTSLLNSQGTHECGGSLIAPDVVLSAAHCQDIVLTALVGRYNRSDSSETYDNLQISGTYVHPSYVFGAYPYDFMLLKLSGSSNRSVLSLNDKASLPSDTQQGLIVMGFGLRQTGNLSSIPAILQQVSVTVVPNSICGQAQQRGVSQSYVGQITPDMLCADDLGKDSCQGDSGGPLIIPGNIAAEDIQVGHVSWGLGCALSAFPGVYARTSSGFAWIASTVCAISSDPPSSFLCHDDGTSAYSISPSPTGPPVPLTSAHAPSQWIVPVTVVICLDASPTDTAWTIEDADGTSEEFVVSGDSYNTSWATVVETVYLRCGHHYVLNVQDSFGDGLQSAGYRVVLGPSANGTIILAMGSGSFLSQTEERFIVPCNYQGGLTIPSNTTNSTNNYNSNVNTPTPSPIALWDAIEVPGGQQGTVFLTVEIQLDQYPEQTSWRLDSLGIRLAELARVPPGRYVEPSGGVQTTVELDAGRTYIFTVFDEGQDGIENGFVRLYLEPNDGSNSSAIILNQKGDFGPGFQFTFEAASKQLTSPASPQSGNNFLTLELRFDLYPNETGVVVEALDSDHIQILLFRPPGYYFNTVHANQMVYEYVALPSNASESTVYTLTMIDTFSDGLCCSHNGNLPYTTGYTLYNGSVAGGAVLVTSRFKSAPKEESRFALSLPQNSLDRSLTAASPCLNTTASYAVLVSLHIEDINEQQIGYFIQDASGNYIINRAPGTLSEPEVNETFSLKRGVYYFGLVESNGLGFSGSYQVRLASEWDRPPFLWGRNVPGGENNDLLLRQAFLVEGLDAGAFPLAILIETDNQPNQIGFYLERFDVVFNGTGTDSNNAAAPAAALAAQVPVGTYQASHSILPGPLSVEEGGLYRLVMLDGGGDGTDGRVMIILSGVELDTNSSAVPVRVITIFGTSYESQGYYTFLAQKDEPPAPSSPSTCIKNLTLQIQFDVLPMGVDWTLMSDSNMPTVLTQRSVLEGPYLIAYGPQTTPILTDYSKREMIATILVPQQRGGGELAATTTLTLSVAFRVNALCCPNGLSGSYELYDHDGDVSLLSRGQFSQAQRVTTSFTTGVSADGAHQQSAAANVFNARVFTIARWTSLSLVSCIIVGAFR